MNINLTIDGHKVQAETGQTVLQAARQAGADAIVVACPLCHTNLAARQFQMKLGDELPLLYFTELMVLALGLPEKSAALDKNIVDPRPMLRNKGLIPG